MHKHSRSRSPRRIRRLITALAALVVVAAGAAACGSSQTTITGTSGQASDQASSSTDTASSSAQPASAPANDDNTDGAPVGYGDQPDVQTWRISADAIRYSGNLVGFDYTYTEIVDRQGDLEYISIGDDSGLRASYLDDGAGFMQVCVETSAGCGAGVPGDVARNSYIDSAFAAWRPQTLDDGLRVAGGIVLGESVGWEISDPNFSIDGRPGRCYRSLGQYQWEGDPEPTITAFPAGDVACVLFYETSSEYLVSYDFGGDGSFELDTIRLVDSYSDTDFAVPGYASGTDDLDALVTILENSRTETRSGGQYAVINSGS